MGFPAGCFVIIELLVLLALLLLGMVSLTVMFVLRTLGLFCSLWDLSVNLFLITASRSVAPPSPSSMKDQLRVVEYQSFMGEEEPRCMVCLEDLEDRDELKELGTCCHAFHKGCIDQWIDMGQATCPMCRSQLLPVKKTVMGRVMLKLLPKIW